MIHSGLDGVRYSHRTETEVVCVTQSRTFNSQHGIHHVFCPLHHDGRQWPQVVATPCWGPGDNHSHSQAAGDVLSTLLQSVEDAWHVFRSYALLGLSRAAGVIVGLCERCSSISFLLFSSKFSFCFMCVEIVYKTLACKIVLRINNVWKGVFMQIQDQNSMWHPRNQFIFLCCFFFWQVPMPHFKEVLRKNKLTGYIN